MAGHDIVGDYKVLVEEPSLVAVAAVVEIVLALATMIHLRVGHLQAGHLHKDRMDLDLDIDEVEHFEVIVVRAVIVVMN